MQAIDSLGIGAILTVTTQAIAPHPLTAIPRNNPINPFNPLFQRNVAHYPMTENLP